MMLTDDIPINEPWPFETEADRLIALHDRLPALKAEQTRWLIREGVPSQSLVVPDPLRRGCVVFMPAGRFEFEPDYRGDQTATETVLLLAYAADGVPDDLCAWCPRSGRLAAWLGRCPWVGDPFAPRCSDRLALAVFESPLQWLRAGRDGVVLIENSPGLARQLDGAGPLQAQSRDHARRLEKVLTAKAPKVFTQKYVSQVA
jgi:hypothetical protein